MEYKKIELALLEQLAMELPDQYDLNTTYYVIDGDDETERIFVINELGEYVNA